jgi:general secretion pathway protein G
MISTLKKLQDKKAAQENSGGFTLIELLIVIVVLGILAAVVVFSLGSVTSKSAVSACQADGATINTAMAAYNANNGAYPLTSSALTSSASGGPYLQSWPANYGHYTFAMDTDTGGLWVIASSGSTPAPTPPAILTHTAGSNYTYANFVPGSGNPTWVAWSGNGAQACVTAGVK